LPKPQQIHDPGFISALRAKITDILNADVLGKDIRQLRGWADTQNTSFRFLKFSETFLAGFY